MTEASERLHLLLRQPLRIGVFYVMVHISPEIAQDMVLDMVARASSRASPSTATRPRWMRTMPRASKSKGKGKSKKGMYLNADAVWKGKGNGPDWGSRSVNAYAASTDYFMGGLELSPTMDMASATTNTARPERGMIDCGATASAAPAAVVKGLIASILEKDHGARGDIESNSRPYFRFGDGRWGRDRVLV